MMKNYNILGVRWKIWLLVGLTKNQYRGGDCLKRGAWTVCRFEVGLARKRGWCFWGGGWYTNANYDQSAQKTLDTSLILFHICTNKCLNCNITFTADFAFIVTFIFSMIHCFIFFQCLLNSFQNFFCSFLRGSTFIDNIFQKQKRKLPLKKIKYSVKIKSISKIKLWDLFLTVNGTICSLSHCNCQNTQPFLF